MIQNDISERYLKKAIAEINELGDEIARAAVAADRVPVLGSGHPLAEIFLVKHRPQPAEVQEGVAAQQTAATKGGKKTGCHNVLLR